MQSVTHETAAGRIRVIVFQDFQNALDDWASLEVSGICVNAQTAERARLWFENVSITQSAVPVIAVGRSESGETQFVWPFKMVQKNGVKCLHWIGWQQANYQMGLHTLNFARNVAHEDMHEILSHVASVAGANVALLHHQPFEWDGVANPMAMLPHQLSSNLGYSVLLDRDFDNLFRNRFSGKSRNTLRRKEKKLQAAGDVEMRWAGTADERHALLEVFFQQKSRQFAEQGIADPFKDEPVRAFYHDLASLPSGQDGTLEIAFLKVDSDIVAISCGIRHRDKFETLLTSIELGPVSRHSPGAILAKFQIEDCCRLGLNFFDMGTGDAPHKADWCDVNTPLFETAIAFDEKGYLVTLPYIAQTAGKRFIKSRPALWSMARSVRSMLYGSAGTTTSVPERVVR